MTLHLGDNVAVRSEDVICILDLTGETGGDTLDLLKGAEEESRLLLSQGTAKSAVLCAGARRAGGVSENARIYLSAISSRTLMQRTWAYSISELVKQDEIRQRRRAQAELDRASTGKEEK